MSLLSPTILPLSLACPPGGCTLEPVPTAAAAAYPEPLAAPHACVEEDRKKDEPALRCAASPPSSQKPTLSNISSCECNRVPPPPRSPPPCGKKKVDGGAVVEEDCAF